MRPITLTILTEILRIVSHAEPVSVEVIHRALSISESRAREVLRQLCEMNLLRAGRGDVFSLTTVGNEFLDSILTENRTKANKILLTYPPYRSIYRPLQRQSMSKEELSKETGQSMVGIDTLLRLMRWANPKLKQNRKTGRYFITHPAAFSLSFFLETLRKTYCNMSHAPFGIHRRFVKIPELRRSICELLHLDTESFDSFLMEAYRNYPESIELTSAPGPATYRSKERGIMDRGLHLFYARISSEQEMIEI